MLISAYSTVRARVSHDFPVVNERSRWEVGATDAELDAHLSALERWAMSNSRASDPSRRLLINHINDTRRLYQFELDAHDPKHLDNLRRFSEASNSILLVDGALLDGDGRPLLSGPHGTPTGWVPITSRARSRRDEVRSWLESNVQLQVPNFLPPIRSADELEFRSAIDVALGIISLVMASDYAASVIAGSPINQKAMEATFPRAFASLAPSHRELFETNDSALARTVQPVIEAAQELLWTVSRSMPGWPAQAADAAEVMRLALAEGEQVGVDTARLRPADEILDEYECIQDLALAQNGQLCDLAITRQRLIGLTWATHAHLDWDQATARVDALISGDDGQAT